MATNEENMGEISESLKAIKEILARQDERDAKSDSKDDKSNKEKKKDDKNRFQKIHKTLKKEIPGVSTVINKGYSMMSQAFKQSMDIQKEALSRGSNLGDIMQRAEKANYSSSKTMAGAILPLGLEMDKLAAGMTRSSRATDDLAMFTKMTGGDTRKLFKQLAKLDFGVGMSTEQNAKLGTTIMSLSQNFGMSVEELMGTIEGLDQAMPMYKMLGIAPQISEATARLGAALGQEAGAMSSEIMTAFTSANGAVLAAQLGVMEERNALLDKEKANVQTSFRMMEAAGSEAAKLYDSYLQGSGDKAIAFEAVQNALGPAMAQTALMYKDMEKTAKEQNMSVRDYLDGVAKQNEVSANFNATMDQFINVLFKPITKAVTFLAEKLTQVITFLNNSPILMGVLQGLVALGVGIAVLAGGIGLLVGPIFGLIGQMKLLTLSLTKNRGKGMFSGLKGLFSRKDKGGGGAAAAAADPAIAKTAKAGNPFKGFSKGMANIGKGISKLAKGMANGLGKLGKGIAKLGQGVGKGIAAVLGGIAKGIAMFGSPKVIKGALGMALVGVALIPMAFALKLMKGVGIKEILTLGGALLFFGTMMALVGAFIGPVLPMLILGAAVFSLIGAAMVPLAFALSLVTGPLAAFSLILRALSGVNPFAIAAMGPALVSLSMGLMALAAGSVVGAIVNFFTGDNNPIDKLIELGKAAGEINKLADSLDSLSPALDRLGKGLESFDSGNVEKIKDIADAARKTKLTPFQDIKLRQSYPMDDDDLIAGRFRKVESKANASNMIQKDGYSLGPGQFNYLTREYTGPSSGVDQGDLDRAKQALAEQKERVANLPTQTSSRRERMEQDKLDAAQETVDILKSILGQNEVSLKQRNELRELQESLQNRPPVYQPSR